MSRMKHLLRKLHIGVGGGGGLNEPHHRLAETVRQPLVSPNSNPSSTSPPSSSSTTNGAITPVESAAADQMTADFFEEEYQVQLALAISASDLPAARVDPESAQIDAAKRISLGSTATAADSQALVEYLSLRYWTYNVVNYDEKVLDGFYDVYGITSSSVLPDKMPLLVDLQAISVSDNVDYEVILVNRLGDPDLQQLEQKVATLHKECGVSELGPMLSGLIQKIADIVVHRMGGPVGDADEMLKRWQLRSYELRNALNTIVLPLGCLDVGLSRHRALLFKVLADKINLPCILIKGSYYTGTDDGAVNLIKIDNGSEYIIDLMGAPGTLIPAEVPSSHLSSTGFITRSFTDVTETSGSPHLGFDRGTVTLADLCQMDTVPGDGSLVLGKGSSVSLQTKKNERNVAENNQTEKFEYDFGKLRPKLGKSSEGSTDGFARASHAEKMKINNVSKYVVSASKDPDFAQKLHAVLLDSEGSGPSDLFSNGDPQDLVRHIVSEQLDIPVQWCPEQPFLTTFSQLTYDVCHNNEKKYPVERTAENQVRSEKDIIDFSFSSDAASEGIVLVSGRSNQTIKPNVRGSDIVLSCGPETSSSPLCQETVYDLSSPFAADSCQSKLDNVIACNDKQQFQVKVQDNNVGSCEDPPLEVIEKSDNTRNGHRERVDQVLCEVAEWEIPWEHIQIGERIGIGSYGEVYRADWNGTEVAVKKFLDQDLSGDALSQFRCEIEIMLRLRHPNVVLFMGSVTRPPHLSILTEFLPRGSLYKLLHRPHQHLDERRRLKMALDVAKGMNYLHSSHPPVVHRDLKTPNLLVDKNWVVKVCDFGLSRMKHHTFLSSKSTAGTPEWMAPEVLRNEPANEKCDVYSFGVILWELTTMCIPWKGLNPMQVVGAVGFQNRRLEIPENVDPAVAQIINDCWQTEPHLRPSFSQLMSRLRHIQRLIVNNMQSKSKNLVAAPAPVQ